jgi:hypothetical protein
MKNYVVQLSQELFNIKVELEKELGSGNKSNEELYLLIIKMINFLKSRRSGEPVSKKLPIYKYFELKYSITNLFLVKLNKSARAFYTNVSRDEFRILQIILEVHQTHKEYEKKGKYNRH